jgi:iron complex transport system substrate-binding protein
VKLKIWSLYLAALLAFVLMIGCTSSQESSPAASNQPASPTTVAQTTLSSTSTASKAASYPQTITDDLKRQVNVEREPQRIVSLSPSNTELVYALGVQDKLVGVDDYSDYPVEAKAKEKVGGYSKPNLEKIIALRPDLILATDIHAKTVVPELEKQNLTVIIFKPATVEATLDNLALLGKVTGRSAPAEELNKTLRTRIDAVVSKAKARTTKTRVFMEVSPELITVGPGTFINDMIEKAGGQNIASDAQGTWPKLGPESIVVKDPEVIFLCDHGSDLGGVTIDSVKQRPGWNTVSAIKNSRIIAVPDVNIVNRPSYRAVEGLEFLAKAIQGDASP